ncbi:MAG: alpha-D-ribose 1-methylphosphonate 5-triphosphate diphosphatase [Pseudomonadota bacterium]
MQNPLVLANADLVLVDRMARGSLTVADGHITEVTLGGQVPAGAVDCGGDLLTPGLVELHTDNLERHLEPRAGVAWPVDAAIAAHDGELASAGITTVFDALRVGSILSGRKGGTGAYAREVASRILVLRDQRRLRISHFLHLRAEICSETLLEELELFGPEDRIGILSLMDHTPGQRQFRDVSKLKDYLCSKRGLSELEFIDHVAELSALHRRVGDAHEAAAVHAARRCGAVLASHDDTTAAQVTVSAQHGARLAEFPTTQEAARASRDAGIAVMMGAPNLIRGGSHSGNVAAADLLASGDLDILSSDYVPGALLMGAVEIGWRCGDMARGFHAVTEAPARAVGLDDRGRLEAGRRADILRISLPPDGAPVLRGVWSQGRQVG